MPTIAANTIFVNFVESNDYAIADYRLSNKSDTHTIELEYPGCPGDILSDVLSNARLRYPHADIKRIVADCSPEYAAWVDIDVPVVPLEQAGDTNALMAEFTGLRTEQELQECAEQR